MSIDLYVDGEAVELNATCSPVPVFALPDTTMTVLSGGYSTAGDDHGPRDFPPNIEEGS